MSDTEPTAVPDATRDAAARRIESRQSSVAQWSSVLALAISFLALAVGAYQTRLMQSQARAGVWPYVSIGYTYFGLGENAGFVWRIDNDGVGPARIGWATLSLDDRAMKHWTDVFAALQSDGIDFATIYTITGKVLPPNTNRETTIPAIKLTQTDIARKFFDARDRFKMTICYCSVYDECWVATYRESRVQPIPTCDAPPKDSFEQ